MLRPEPAAAGPRARAPRQPRHWLTAGQFGGGDRSAEATVALAQRTTAPTGSGRRRGRDVGGRDAWLPDRPGADPAGLRAWHDGQR